MEFFRRSKRKERLKAPPDPPEISESIVEDARAGLAEATKRDSLIDQERARLLKIQRDNALGPRFWAAVGERRA